ncbi:MAG: OmpH family outer membrane protein [Crocinitomicaceae bacterium]|nr:OmpH family outer membrane protein [Crocinitomicaceae bacterium]
MENNNKLAKLSLGINVVLLIAVIILFVKMPSSAGESAEDVDSTKVEIDNTNPTTIAYFNNDSLNIHSDFMVEVQMEIENVTKDAQNKIASKEAEITKWQQKWESKGQLLPREMEQAQAEGAKLEQEYAMLQQQVQMDMAQQTQDLMMTMYTRITKYAEDFCNKNNIDMLMSYQLGGGLIYISHDLDVTSQFINYCNQQYSGLGEETTEGTEGEEG